MDIYVIPNFRIENNKELPIETSDSEKVEEIREVYERYNDLSFEEFINNITLEQKNIVILGKPGSGKSMLMKYLMYKFLNKETLDSSLIYLPLRIELRKYLQLKKQYNYIFTEKFRV